MSDKTLRLEVIDHFSGPHAFLSNFFPTPVQYHGITYASSEHAYQAAKARFKDQHDYIAAARWPAEAKRRGRALTSAQIRIDWEQSKFAIMFDIVTAKFRQHPELQKRLLTTGEAQLIEGNDWGDRIWGMTRNDMGQWAGNNWLGEILMWVRTNARLKTWQASVDNLI